ncbi:MAG: YbhB/YbcL family Raf kinase inhibitor-like protein [archaeon]|nr:YbhB/YbcL family Raf kinase inhibitor-like protein [archaeon]
MQIRSEAIVDGWIQDRYGGKGTEWIGPRSSLSIPFEIEDAPEGTVSFAVVFSDPDVVRLKGFVFMHWLISGLTRTSLPENASRTDPTLVQGVTSWYPGRIPDRLDSCFYGGPNPPDAPHTYVLKAYALDFIPSLVTGFTHDELMAEIEGHIISECEIHGLYSPRQ